MPLLGNAKKGHEDQGELEDAGFDNDIFISYAHIDNETFLDNEKGWISKLHRALELRIGQLRGQPPKIWRDPKIQGNDAFADRLDGEVPKTALLVSVLSPRYLRSDWCQRELQTFISASERSGGTSIADKSRIFKVVKTPISVEDQPPLLQKMLGYEFFRSDPETGRPSELVPDDPEIRRHYWSRLDDLAYDISQMLDLLEESATRAAPSEPAEVGADAPEGAPTEASETADSIYLASTSVDLRDERDALRRDLMLRGYRVLPEEPISMVADELIAATREQLAQCLISIHLVGRSYGMVPEGATESGPALESALARQRVDEGGGFARLVWLPPELETLDGRQQALIEDLRSDPRLGSADDLLECPFESLKTEIHLRLEKPAETPSKTSEDPQDEGGSKQIYLVFDSRDEEAAIEIEDFLFDSGFEVIASCFEGDEAQVRLDHQENLRECDAVLIYYGAVNEPWLRRKLREVRKSPGFGREQPLLGTAVYMAPPTTSRKSRFKTHEAMVLGDIATSNPAQLEPFLERLRQPLGSSDR